MSDYEPTLPQSEFSFSSQPGSPPPQESKSFGGMLANSWLGVASMGIGVVAFLGFCLSIVLITVVAGGADLYFLEQMAAGNMNAIPDDMLTQLYFLVCCFCSTPLFGLIGLGMGIGGLFQQKASKGFAIGGIVVNAIYLAGFVCLLLYSMMINA